MLYKLRFYTQLCFQERLLQSNYVDKIIWATARVGLTPVPLLYLLLIGKGKRAMQKDNDYRLPGTDKPEMLLTKNVSYSSIIHLN